MDFEDARLVLLYVLAHEELLLHLEMAESDVDLEPDFDVYADTAYEQLHSNRERSLVLHILDYQEDEIVYVCRNLWESFT